MHYDTTEIDIAKGITSIIESLIIKELLLLDSWW